MESAVKTVAGAAKKAVNAFATSQFTVSGSSGLVSTSTRESTRSRRATTHCKKKGPHSDVRTTLIRSTAWFNCIHHLFISASVVHLRLISAPSRLTGLPTPPPRFAHGISTTEQDQATLQKQSRSSSLPWTVAASARDRRKATLMLSKCECCSRPTPTLMQQAPRLSTADAVRY